MSWRLHRSRDPESSGDVGARLLRPDRRKVDLAEAGSSGGCSSQTVTARLHPHLKNVTDHWITSFQMLKLWISVGAVAAEINSQVRESVIFFLSRRASCVCHQATARHSGNDDQIEIVRMK